MEKSTRRTRRGYWRLFQRSILFSFANLTGLKTTTRFMKLWDRQKKEI